MKVFGVQIGKTDDQKWAEAKTSAHETRAANGQRVTGRAAAYTPAQQIADQQREIAAKNKPATKKGRRK